MKAVDGTTWSDNPVWLIMDVLLRSGWAKEDLNLASFAQTAKDLDSRIRTNESEQSGELESPA